VTPEVASFFGPGGKVNQVPYWGVPIFQNPFESPWGYSGPQHPEWPNPIRSLLFHNPFEGPFGYSGPQHPQWPDPAPRAVAFLVSAVTSKAAAVHMTNSANNPAAQQIIAAADSAIAAFIDSDDICPRWPWPGPPPWLSIIASELTWVANSLQEGGLRSGLLQVAGQVLDRAQALSTAGT
jgi:hypothetical protein